MKHPPRGFARVKPPSRGSARLHAKMVLSGVRKLISMAPATVLAKDPGPQEHIIRSLHCGRAAVVAGHVPFPTQAVRRWLLEYLAPLLATIDGEEVILDVDGSLPTEEPPT